MQGVEKQTPPFDGRNCRVIRERHGFREEWRVVVSFVVYHVGRVLYVTYLILTKTLEIKVEFLF